MVKRTIGVNCTNSSSMFYILRHHQVPVGAVRHMNALRRAYVDAGSALSPRTSLRIKCSLAHGQGCTHYHYSVTGSSLKVREALNK